MNVVSFIYYAVTVWLIQVAIFVKKKVKKKNIFT